MIDLEEIFGEAGPLARGLPGFRTRESQLAMARAAATALQARG